MQNNECCGEIEPKGNLLRNALYVPKDVGRANRWTQHSPPERV